jgi:cobalt-zinc-cadmium efflux system outer membrane protein
MRHGVPLAGARMGATPYDGRPVVMFERGAFRWMHGAHLAKRANNEMTHVHATRLAIALVCLTGFLAIPGRAGAQAIPEPAPLPMQLTLEQSLKVLRARGLDMLIAETQVHSAEGDVGVAGAVPNPSLTLTYGRVFTYNPNVPPSTPAMPTQSCAQNNAFCDLNLYSAGITDQAAIEDTLSGKRDLRLKVANAALAAAKLTRTDALRNLEFQVKSAYLQIAQAQRALDFAKQAQATNVRTLELFQVRLRGGAVNEGDVARVETQKLESDQAVDQAAEAIHQARFALAFLLGVRGPVPEFSVDDHVLDFSVPPDLETPSVDHLLRTAFDHRPDLLAFGYQRQSAQAAIALAKRQRFPDITVGIGYTQTGTGGEGVNAPLQPPTGTINLSAPIPIFYQQQGEIRKAEANYDSQSLQHAKAAAQVVSDVSAAMSTFETSRGLVDRMEKGGLLRSAKTARDIIRTQFERGAATLLDFLDAQRTYIATNVEYFQDLTNYWTAVAQLEQAVGMELHQ